MIVALPGLFSYFFVIVALPGLFSYFFLFINFAYLSNHLVEDELIASIVFNVV